MRRSGFLLGLFSVGGQVLLLRELVSSLNGDELFIGTALFGWLISVAAGAFLGGCRRKSSGKLLFIVGAAMLPAFVILIRLSPIILTDYAGEIIPFVRAALLSIVAMAPIGIISGWLFTAISQKEGLNPATTIGTVYLFEGLGAFVGGLVIAVTAGGLVSTLGLALMLMIVVMAAALAMHKRPLYLPAGIAAVILVAGAYFATILIDARLDAVRYPGYDIKASFDTHYSHQTILQRDESIILMTDNTIEAIYPDLETAENILIPPLLYYPQAQRILYFGRAEFGVFRLAGELGLNVTAVDPREKLDRQLDRLIPPSGPETRVIDDPMRFLTGSSAMETYDIVIIDPGEPGNYQNSRFVTGKFLSRAGGLLSPGGIIYLPTHYDTDRFIAPEKASLLAIIHNSLQRIYVNVGFWPGNMTLFFASAARKFDLPSDSLSARADNLPFRTQYVHPDYMFDRLDEIKTTRLKQALGSVTYVNSLNKPVLPHYQAIYRALTDSLDRRLLNIILKYPVWVTVVPVAVLLFLIQSVLRNRRTNQFALFLYFIAGFASLSLELISFYLYQTTAGSLYAEMAVLIGSFMLGLALGTFYSMRCSPQRPLELPALMLLLAAGLIFAASWKSVGTVAAVPYYAFFLFVVALSTGTLFVGATNRYYTESWLANRGVGYAWEVAGSSLGALLTTTIILPVIGLGWLLWSVAILVGLTLVGALMTGRG